MLIFSNKIKGFSLIELMVAIGIGTTMMAAITTNYSQLSQFFVTLKQNSSRLMEVNRAQKLLQADKDPGSLSGGIFEAKIPVDRSGDGTADGNANIFNPMILAVESSAGETMDPTNLPAAADTYVKRILILQSKKDYSVEAISTDGSTITLKNTFREPTLPAEKVSYAAMLVNSITGDRFFNETQSILAKRQVRNFSFFQIAQPIVTDADGRSTLTVADPNRPHLSVFSLLNNRIGTDSTNVFGFNFFVPAENVATNRVLDNDPTIVGVAPVPNAASMYIPRAEIYGPNGKDGEGPFITAQREAQKAKNKDEIDLDNPLLLTNTGPILHHVQVIEYLVIPSIKTTEMVGSALDIPVYYRNIYRSIYPCPNGPNILLPATEVHPNFAGTTVGCDLTLVLANASVSEFDVAIDTTAGYNRGVNVAFGFKPRGFRTGGKMRLADQTGGQKMGTLRNIAPTKRRAPKFRKSALESNPDLDETQIEETTPLPCNYYKGQVLSPENNLMGVQFPRICTGRSNSGLSAEIEEAAKTNTSVVAGFDLADLTYMNSQATRPSDIIFLLDMTASMRPYWDGLRDYLQGFLQQLSEETKLSFRLHIRGYQDGYNELGRTFKADETQFTPDSFPPLYFYTIPGDPRTRLTEILNNEGADFPTNFVPACPKGYTPEAIDNAKLAFFNKINESGNSKGGDHPENPAYAIANALKSNTKKDTGGLDLQGADLGDGIPGGGTFPTEQQINNYLGGVNANAALPFGRLILNLLPEAVKKSYGYPQLDSLVKKIYSVVPFNYFGSGKLSQARKNTTLMILITDTFPQFPDLISRLVPNAPDNCNSVFVGNSAMATNKIKYFSYGNGIETTDYPAGTKFDFATSQLGDEWRSNLLFYYIVPATRMRCDATVSPYGEWLKDASNTPSWDTYDPYYIRDAAFMEIHDREEQALYIRTDPVYDMEITGWIPNRSAVLYGQVPPNIKIDGNNPMSQSLKEQLERTSWGNITGTSSLSDATHSFDLDNLPLLEKAIFTDLANYFPNGPAPLSSCTDGSTSPTCWANYIKILFGMQLRNLIDRVKERLDPTAKSCHLIGDFNIIAWPVVEDQTYCATTTMVNGVETETPSTAPCVALRSGTSASKYTKPYGFVHFGHIDYAPVIGDIASRPKRSGFFHQLFKDAANDLKVSVNTDYVAFNDKEEPPGMPEFSKASIVSYPEHPTPLVLTNSTEGYLNAFLEKIEKLTIGNARPIFKTNRAKEGFAVLEFQMLYCCQSGVEGEPFDPIKTYDTSADLLKDLGKCSMQKVSKFVGLGTPPDKFKWDIRYPKTTTTGCKLDP